MPDRVYTALSSAMALSVTPLWAAAFGCNVEKQYHLCALDFIAEGAAGPKYAVVHRQTNEIACTNRRYVTRADQGKIRENITVQPR
jgi:hypothetical protein